eukprot:2298994-Rhodomonas_salina.1
MDYFEPKFQLFQFCSKIAKNQGNLRKSGTEIDRKSDSRAMAIGRGEQEVVEVRSGDVETLLQDSAWFRTRRRKVRVVFGAFVAVALSAVAVAMLGDSWGLPDSQSNVLAQTRVEMEKMSRTQITMALAANSALHLKKRFISLAENSTE